MCHLDQELIQVALDEYLGTHYELLREDSIKGLRDAVLSIKFTPEAKEDAFNGAIGIYDKARHL